MSIQCILYVVAFVTAVVAAAGKCPIYVPVLILSIAALFGCFSH